ncbi:MAG: hypothetical protein HY456_00005 [Parcubacteria group bacterium]|nr:hypothetical protein [Parcubacteria group bacterium]
MKFQIRRADRRHQLIYEVRRDDPDVLVGNKTEEKMAQLAPAVKEIKKRLRKAGFGYLRVHRDRGTGHCWLVIHRPNGVEVLNRKEVTAICKAFGQKDDGRKSNVYLIREFVAEMKLGLQPKQPVCESCGCPYDTEEEARECVRYH